MNGTSCHGVRAVMLFRIVAITLDSQWYSMTQISVWERGRVFGFDDQCTGLGMRFGLLELEFVGLGRDSYHCAGARSLMI